MVTPMAGILAMSISIVVQPVPPRCYSFDLFIGLKVASTALKSVYYCSYPTPETAEKVSWYVEAMSEWYSLCRCR